MSSSHPERSPLSAAQIDAWREDVASPAELRRSYERYLRNPRKKRAAPLLRFILIGSLVGIGLAQGATVARRWLGLGRRSEVTQSAPPARASGPATRVAAPALPRASALSFEEPAELPHPAPKTASSSPAAVAAHVQAQWQSAAAAIKAHDSNEALRALLDIERSASGGERDAARLARAQLLLGDGRSAEATHLLTELEQQAQSSLVRDKARAILQRSAASGDFDRSLAPGRDTQQP